MFWCNEQTERQNELKWKLIDNDDDDDDGQL